MVTLVQQKVSSVHNEYSFESLVIHGDDGIEDTLDIAPPIHQTSTFASDSAAEFSHQATDPRPSHYYTRAGNPTHQRVEAIMNAEVLRDQEQRPCQRIGR